ncbi:hypothetical protein [Streptomyces sp. Amel2xB2]|uniref:hypothetical protein n=1 Tax=Streptomyces sp. Amel2xB2 TaxID=1305829 RepID=UPI0011B942E5|nr:hypothetical protein [Streptomyces sp. Amel2xB2]
MILATTTVSVLGGDTTRDEFDDEVDGATVLASGIPAALAEAAKQISEPVSGTPRIVRTHICRIQPGLLPEGLVIDESRRIQDERANETYIVTAASKNANPVMAQPLRFDLKRTGPAA